MSLLKRREFLLGNTPSHQAKANDLEAWNQGLPVLLKAQCLKISCFSQPKYQANRIVGGRDTRRKRLRFYISQITLC